MMVMMIYKYIMRELGNYLAILGSQTWQYLITLEKLPNIFWELQDMPAFTLDLWPPNTPKAGDTLAERDARLKFKHQMARQPKELIAVFHPFDGFFSIMDFFSRKKKPVTNLTVVFSSYRVLPVISCILMVEPAFGFMAFIWKLRSTRKPIFCVASFSRVKLWCFCMIFYFWTVLFSFPHYQRESYWWTLQPL